MRFIVKILLVFCIGPVLASHVAATERPYIWVQEKDKAQILTNIKTKPWANSLYKELKSRADKAVENVDPKGKNYLTDIPLNKTEAGSQFYHILKDSRNTEGAALRKYMMTYLKDGIDCGVLYYLTDDEKYAKCGAYILQLFVENIAPMEIVGDNYNFGIVYPKDHLKEARIFGAQIPLIYDFVYSYLKKTENKKGGNVYSAAQDKMVSFNFADAQHVFSKYIYVALNTGIVDSNWPVLESASLVQNTLALDNKEDRAKFLVYYLEKNTKHQDSLKKVAKSYENPGDIWPESLQYSKHVGQLSLYLMTLLDQIYPDLKLGTKYENIVSSISSDSFLAFPNGDVPSFGDGHRRYKPEYFYPGLAYRSARINNNEALQDRFATLLNTAIASGDFKRGKLSKRTGYPKPYYVPLELLWAEDIPSDKISPITFARSNNLPFNGMFIQRNLAQTDPEINSLMAFVAGGHYVHAHASGMHIELYGKGYVLGMNAGKSKYRTDIHENYYRLFASHNTVVSNGASGSKGGWVNLGIEQVELKHMEPLANQDAISDDFSFSTTTFTDKQNLVAPAEHERTLAVVRTSETSGFYVDIFRAKSDYEKQYHDYIYHNIGESVSVFSNDKKVSFSDDNDRYSASASLKWARNKSYRHPGWHWFTQTQTAKPSSKDHYAVFDTKNLDGKPLKMHAYYPSFTERTYTKTLAPPSLNSYKAYTKVPTPTVVIRQQGEAWDTPFVGVYEPEFASNKSHIKKVENIVVNKNSKPIFKGLNIEVLVNKKTILYTMLLHDETSALKLPKQKITFDGAFAIIKQDDKANIESVYIGQGKSLKIGDAMFKANTNTQNIYKKM